MLRSRFLIATLLVATAASGHSIVDIAMSIDVVKFAPTQQNFTYHVIADNLNNDNGSGVVVTVVKIVNGAISIVAGESGVAGSGDGRGAAAHFDHPTGITLDARGNLFVTDRNGVRRIAPSGLATTVAAGFSGPAGLVVDATDRIFVADSGDHTIRTIAPATAPPPSSGARRRAVR